MELPVWDLQPGPRKRREPAKGEPAAPPARLYGLSAQAPQREVNLVGLRVDEALPLVDKTLDLAVVAGIASISIIHGTGTGRLRAAVRSHLKGHVQVKAFRPGEGRQAGAITVVEVES
jgi:DNA mismatch repair protein MutS2